MNATVQNVSCFSLNDGQIVVTVSGGVLPYTYLTVKHYEVHMTY